MQELIKNPVLRGFNPDPSIVRAGDDYYIATSTFEWFPGVQIHHSKDLVHWELIARPLERLSQLNLAGVPDSGGIWAPCLTYDKGLFYLIYTNVLSYDGIFKDVHNYLVTSDSITGKWSEPVYLNSSGFDPSLFHDSDGRKYLINMLWDHRNKPTMFAGILLQEYDLATKKLVGPIHNIFKGSPIGITEGPHLYKKDGYYYLLTAEGGTTESHAATIARSKEITGPYDIHPDNPVLTSFDNPALKIRKAGHASLVETQNGEWYMAHLCGRPLSNGRCVLGRETSIQKIKWDSDGWPRLYSGGKWPSEAVEAPQLKQAAPSIIANRDDFDDKKLSVHFQSLRVPMSEDWISLQDRPGFLRLKGRESLSSKFNQSLLARRQQAFQYIAETMVQFEPEHFQQSAGLICWYNTTNFFYLSIGFDEFLGKILSVIECDNSCFRQKSEPVSLNALPSVYLRASVNHEKLQFSWSSDGKAWKLVGPILDASILSDEYCTHYPAPGWGFTGAFVGLCCQDLSGNRKHADFDYFDYIESN